MSDHVPIRYKVTRQRIDPPGNVEHEVLSFTDAVEAADWYKVVSEGAKRDRLPYVYLAMEQIE